MRKVCLQPLSVNIGNRWLQNKTAFCDTKRANKQHIANGGYKRYFFLLPAKIQYHRVFQPLFLSMSTKYSIFIESLNKLTLHNIVL